MSGPAWKSSIDLSKLGDVARDDAAKGLVLASEHILGASRRLVPLEEGTLERSGRAAVDREGLRASVSYGTPYAVRQHEDMTLRHDAGRQAKYLEAALEAEKATVLAVLRRAIAGGLSGS